MFFGDSWLFFDKDEVWKYIECPTFAGDGEIRGEMMLSAFEKWVLLGGDSKNY